MKESRLQNTKIYEESVDIDRKYKQCIEVKSNYSKSTFDFEEHREECYQTYKDKYYTLYQLVF